MNHATQRQSGQPAWNSGGALGTLIGLFASILYPITAPLLLEQTTFAGVSLSETMILVIIVGAVIGAAVGHIFYRKQ